MTAIKFRYGDMFRQLTKRHLLVFFRNKIRVFFTLMVPFIIFLIYILFLRDLELTTASGIIEEAGLSLKTDKQLTRHVSTLIDCWMLSGITAISTITVSLQTNWLIVNDKEDGVNRDFASSPVKHSVLIGSYFLFNVIVTVIICFVFLLVCLIYLACMGEFLLNFINFLTICATLIFSSVSSVLLTVFICSFISRDSTMASLNTVFSAAVGFLIGAYMPLSAMPDWVQTVCAFFPGTYSCSLLRYAFLTSPVTELTSYVNSLELSSAEQLLSAVTDSFGFNINFCGIAVAPNFQTLAQCVFILVLTLANIFSAKKMITVRNVVGKKRVRAKK